MLKLLTKISAKAKDLLKALLQSKQPDQKIKERIEILEAQMTSLEKAHVVILTRLLQISSGTISNNKRDDKREILITSPHKDFNAGRTPTYH